MYKKVTHTIVEEHFGHPAAAEIKHTLDAGYNDLRPMFSLTTADNFRSEVSSYFTKMHQRLTGFATTTESGDMDALLTEEIAFFSEVDDLGLLLRPYYGIEFSERLSQIFRGVGLSMVGIDRNLKFKNDVRNQITNLDANFNGLDLLLNQFNNTWALGSAKNMWVPIRESLANEATAIMNKDNSAAVSARTQAAERLGTFATSFANSVVQQYPNKFIQ
jgi:hypothetical protein